MECFATESPQMEEIAVLECLREMSEIAQRVNDGDFNNVGFHMDELTETYDLMIENVINIYNENNDVMNARNVLDRVVYRHRFE
jgi:hypothetical protein